MNDTSPRRAWSLFFLPPLFIPFPSLFASRHHLNALFYTSANFISISQQFLRIPLHYFKFCLPCLSPFCPGWAFPYSLPLHYSPLFWEPTSCSHVSLATGVCLYINTEVLHKKSRNHIYTHTQTLRRRLMDGQENHEWRASRKPFRFMVLSIQFPRRTLI